MSTTVGTGSPRAGSRSAVRRASSTFWRARVSDCPMAIGDTESAASARSPRTSIFRPSSITRVRTSAW